MGNQGETEEKQLIRKIERKGIRLLMVILAIGCIMIIPALFLDLNDSIRYGCYEQLGIGVGDEFTGSNLFLTEMKLALYHSLEDYCTMIITYSTILTAAVIFFYTILENRSGGIPYRTIIAYTFGSWVVPVLFAGTLLFMPILYTIHAAELNVTLFFSSLYLFLIQVAIIGIILISASFNFSIKVICFVEVKQYKILQEQLHTNENSHLYLIRHFEQIIKSDELDVDKLKFIRAIIWVPFYKGIGIRKQCDAARLKSNDLGAVYRFYYENLLASFQYLKIKESEMERSGIYLAIYEFLNKFRSWYEKERNSESEKEMRNIYHMMVSGIMNAALMSGVEERGAFCNYILNQCIADEEIQIKQLNLYMMFQEALYALDREWETQINIKEVTCLGKWNRISSEDFADYALFWHVWMSLYSMPKWKRFEHFGNAIETMAGYRCSSLPIAEFITQIEQKKRGM